MTNSENYPTNAHLAADKSQEFADACQAEIEHGIPKRHVGWGLLWRKSATAATVATQIEAFQVISNTFQKQNMRRSKA